MAVLVTIILGGLIGWAASILMKRDSEQGLIANILVGVAGAVVGSLLFSLFDANPGFTWLITFSFGSIVSAFVGAVAVCAILNYAQRNKAR